MKQKITKIKVGISIGDFNGVGPEIILKTLSKRGLLEFFTPIIFATTDLLNQQKKISELKCNFQEIKNCNEVIEGKINVFNIQQEKVSLSLGTPTPESGAFALKSLEQATKALKNREIDTLVTAPIDKFNTKTEEFNFNGHTGYLNEELEGTAMMFMIHEDLKVALLTEHIALSDVSKQVGVRAICNKIFQLSKTLKSDFQVQKPKIAVLGLNPHNSDQGLMGTEEEKVITPAIKQMQDKGNMVFGPYAADSFFMGTNYQKFDAVLAMYHDQGLIPFKTLTQTEGVNYTAGLNRIRTSPDHGTAFDIAGENKADPLSFQNAIFSSIEIFKTRREYISLNKGKLEKQIVPEYETGKKKREYTSNKKKNTPAKQVENKPKTSLEEKETNLDEKK